MRLPKFIRKLYIKELSCKERQWLYFTRVGVPEGVNMEFPTMTMKQYNKMCEREELYR